MARYRSTVTVPVPPAEAFVFVSDFRNAHLWDPRVSGAEKDPPGPVRVGTRFRLWSPLPVPFASKEIELPYEVTELAAGERLVLDGRTKLFRYRDVITFEPAPSAVPGHGCRITYDARLHLRGPLALGDPLLRPVFRKAGDDAVAGIERALRAEAWRRREGTIRDRVPDLSGEMKPETVAAIVAMDDRPVLRNLLITECYHRIARRLDRMLGGADANWCAYATWASKTAGAFIREEELHEGLRRTLLAKAPLRRRLRRLHEALGHDRHDGGSAFYTDDLGPILGLTGEIARFIRAGNREVFAELGAAFAAFAEEFEGAAGPDPARLDAFLERFRSGESVPDEVEERDGEIVPVHPPGSEGGGQAMLRDALRAYHDALFESEPKRRAELVLLGNALGGLHEQTRLDPYVRGALGAPVDELVHSPDDDALAQRLKRKTVGEGVEALLRETLDRTTRRLAQELTEAVREISTFHLMTLRGPDGVLALGDDLAAPASGRLYPATLDPLEHPELVATLARFGAHPLAAPGLDRLGGGLKGWKRRLRRGLARLRIALRLAPPVAFGSAAWDWGELDERMRYIFVYFRSRQGERGLLQAPFDPRQTAAIAEGHVPRGRL